MRVLLAIATWLVACQTTDVGPTTPPPDVPVAAIEITPSSATFTSLGDTRQLVALAKDASGTTLSGVSFSWTSADPSVISVASAGLAEAHANGMSVITAAAGQVIGTAALVVAQEVSSVDISPTSETIEVGQTAQFSATPNDANGNLVATAQLAWSTSDSSIASVDQTGLATGVGLGSADMTASSDGYSSSATLDVTNMPPPTPQTVFFQEGFEDANLSSRGWYDLRPLHVTNAEAFSGSSAIEFHFGSGVTSDGSGRHLFPESESVYLKYSVKYSANWVGSGQSAHPHEFQFLTNLDPAFRGPAYTHTTLSIEHNYQGGGIPWVRVKDGMNIDINNVNVDLTGVTESRAAHGCNGDGDSHPTQCYGKGNPWNNGKNWSPGQPYFTDTPGSAGYKNDWHVVEVFVQVNSIQNGVGVADGIVQYWFDGQLIIDLDDVLFRTGANPGMKFNQFIMSPYIGAGSPVDQRFWVDDLMVADRR